MAEVLDPARQQVLLEEFKEAGHLHRLHVGLMFGQITVFLGASGALLHRLAAQPPLEPIAVRLFAALGCFLALLFLVLHERVYAYSYRARNRALEIQNLLSVSLYQYPESQFALVRGLKASSLTRTLYVLSLLCWLAIAYFTPALFMSCP